MIWLLISPHCSASSAAHEDPSGVFVCAEERSYRLAQAARAALELEYTDLAYPMARRGLEEVGGTSLSSSIFSPLFPTPYCHLSILLHTDTSAYSILPPLYLTPILTPLYPYYAGWGCGACGCEHQRCQPC